MTNKKIKVLYTIPNFDTAGSGKVVYDLVKGLDRSKFDIAIAVEHNRGDFFKEVEKLGVPIFIQSVVTSYKPYGSLFLRIKKIASFIKQHQFDVVHSWHWSSDWTEVLAARIGGAKYVYTKKAMSWGNKHWKIKSYLSNFIVTINHEMVHYFPKKKEQELIPLGIDMDYYSPKNFDKKPNEKFQIVSVANLVEVKGIEVLVEAVKLINDDAIEVKIVGDTRSDYAQNLIKSINKGAEKKQIEFLGKKPDVRPYLEEADVYVIPTLNKGRKEGMPMALVEAMCMATPTIGSNISGINYVLKDFPNLLFEASNAEQLAERIKLLKQQSEKERQNLGQQLRDYCLANFTMKQFINKHEDLYNQLLK
ncbi:Glycosyltransferase involved in cell wall bisynthesis [Mesonia phycicola]|uniref:Glycosyltransferase involved in cell wall bisynthesis n=1 Tax=Mesonia phycicola TaxID=579105 RepID=A0A1M6AM76_9FLAO|nr:glycosyltransferase family 4 protein [Mesonia phycicola]SHI37576.1 Glycosyltransferase involved in cell wall bisynthesis [Mesonia phycicola]